MCLLTNVADWVEHEESSDADVFSVIKIGNFYL